jgi:uncharacterized protein DUF6580
MSFEGSRKENLVYRVLLALAMIVIAAALRVGPHPWNFTPIGAMALFSGALVRDRRLAFLFPLITLFAGDLFLGFYKTTPVIYASFLLSVLIGRWLQSRRTVGRIAGATLLGAAQFFLVTNFGVWALDGLYPHTLAGLLACYAAGIPFFWNTLAGDAFYAAVLFGTFALAERKFPALREPAPQLSR